MVRPAPGSRANSHARLANAIRVRRAQIAELRDQAIESGDEKLLERADQFEKTLEIFLQNQSRVEANLARAGMRDREAESLLRADAEPPVESSRLQ
jgi:plasmid maintenance system antidote protein VapI